jgi:hypothetical protein
MNDHMSEIAELYTRILQLEILQRSHPDSDSNGAIRDHIQALRRRILDLKSSYLATSSGYSETRSRLHARA